MITYREYEKVVFNWLMKKHDEEPSFTFSVRKKASKGSEDDIFIGTKNSNYFATSFWNIPSGYPGSSIDLIVLTFSKDTESYKYGLQFFFTRNPDGEQNEAALELILKTKPVIQDMFPDRFSQNSPDNKMEFFSVSPTDTFETTEELFSEIELLLDQVIPVIDEKIEVVKNDYPNFTAHRYKEDEFEHLMKKMEKRIEKYSNEETNGINNFDKEDDSKLDGIKEIKFSLNQILYGPPGTGKTYNTLNHALAIIENDAKYLKGGDLSRDDVREKFDRYKKNRQARFVTFHPSFSYEDFVEGIKPILTSSEDDDTNDVSYQIEDGIFKDICNSATETMRLRKKKVGGHPLVPEQFFDSDGYHKISLGNSNRSEDDNIYKHCIDQNLISIGYLNDVDLTGADSLDEIRKRAKEKGYGSTEFGIDAMHRFKNWMKEDHVVIVSEGLSKVRAIGLISNKGGNGYFYDPNTELRYSHFRHVDWILTDVEIPILDIYYKKLSQQTIYMIGKEHINFNYFSVQKEDLKDDKRFVLIIDEINRGNVPSIFGELITLLEPDKRADGNESTSVTLPYSKKQFEVPSNLYLIGTMNTADRSVEALDAALRRRFEFKSFYPDPGKVKQPEDFNVDLRVLLTVINHRIEYLLDRDHTIGHSYFMDLHKKDDPAKELKSIFKHELIPLLEEYFYGQLHNIGLILGDEFIQTKFKEGHSTNLFASNFNSQEAPTERVVYRVIDPNTFTSIQPFINIYAES